MAGGLEWSRSVQPLLTTSHSVLDKKDIPEIVKTIVKSETDILEHEDQYEPFYSSFVALATHYLSHSLTAVPKTSWNNLYEACKILMKYLLDRLQNYNEGCAITQKMQMFLLKSLCTGTTSMSKTDISTFTAILKFAKVPSIVRQESDAVSETTAVQVKETSNCSRLDIGTDIFDQLTSAFNDLSLAKSQKNDTGEDEHVDAEIKDEFKEETKMMFGKRNLHSLQQLDGGKTLVDVCSRLTFLGRYKERYRDAISGGSFILPNTLSEALTMRNSFLPLLNEISIVWRAFSLPILEPLTQKRMENIVTVMMSCLYASLSVAVTNTVIAMTSTAPVKPATGKEEENENYGCSIIQKSLEIFGIVTSAVKSSSRAGGNVAQNVNLMAAWLLLKGLQNIISLTPAVILERKDSKQKADAKSKDSRPNSAKSSFQGFGAVSVALATKALHLVEELMNDLQLEGLYQDMGVSSSGSGLDFPIMQSETAWRRVQKLLSNIPLVDLLLSLVTTSFKKACLLRRLKLGSETSETSSSSASDSITFYEDDFSSSEDSSEDEE
ncbi:E3 ubiquitin-protein ligase UBR4, partial [Mytilus galloprovincialis]